MRIAFLGLGQMGSSIATLLVQEGYDVTVWNRSEGPEASLLALGAKVADSPANAVANAQAIFTMLLDDRALESILFEQGALAAMPEGAIHASLSTISVILAERLEREHADRRQRYVGTPVFGRPDVAAAGKLWLAVAGPEDVLAEITPVLNVFSRGLTVVSDRPSRAHSVKVAGNFMITAMIAALSEAFTTMEASGVDEAVFLEAINNALFQSPLYGKYGKLMLEPPEQVGATVELGAKDTRLFREAAKEVASRTPLADIFQQQLNSAIQSGAGAEDWAAGYLRLARSEAKGLEKA